MRRERPVRTVGLVLLVWLALSVPLGILVGKWLARQDRPENRVPPDLLERQARLDRLARPASQAPRVCPDQRARRGHQDRQAQQDRRRLN